MTNKFFSAFLAAACFSALLFFAIITLSNRGESPARSSSGYSTRVIRDAAGREAVIPEDVEYVICSGSGTLRLLTYLRGLDKLAGVDSIETRGSAIDARPYALANPQLADYPQFGEFRGYDSPERILGLSPAPQVIFKTSGAGGEKPARLEDKTGIPVVVIDYGDLTGRREELYNSLKLMGEVIGNEKRAREVITFIDEMIGDLNSRTARIPEDNRPGCYAGGIAMRGPHGFNSTERAYPPFIFTSSRNVAGELTGGAGSSHANMAKEQIVAWDPDIIFIDISTIRAGDRAGALYELMTDPAYRDMTAVKKGAVFGVLPHNSYNANFGSILANAYFVGKVLYPENFSDIDPAEKADEIYEFLLGERVFEKMNSAFGRKAFRRLAVE